MTDEREIEAREKAATPGEWEYTVGFYGWDNGIFPVGCEDKLNQSIIANNGHANGDPSDADADFIAHAREDIPYLLAQLREARALGVQAWQWYNREAATSGGLIHAEAERDEARGKLEALEPVRVLIPHSVPNEPVYYPSIPQCHPQCQRCKIDRILHPQEAE